MRRFAITVLGVGVLALSSACDTRPPGPRHEPGPAPGEDGGTGGGTGGNGGGTDRGQAFGCSAS